MTTQSRWTEEKTAAYLCRTIAAVEPDPVKAELFRNLAKAAEDQAAILAKDLTGSGLAFAPSMRAEVVAWLIRRVGPRRMRPVLAASKVRGISVYSGPQAPLDHPWPTTTEESRARHATGGGGSLRAAVFGANDGLVSNTCLVMGVAGAAVEPKMILVSGVAGLLAGAFSMAAGEYISMLSQREMFEHQIAQERAELERYPEEEAEELALIYAARGIPIEDARKIATRLIADKEKALDTLAREELGLNPDDLGSPWGAAFYSFIAFAAGAILPLIPFLLGATGNGIYIASALSAVALFGVGAALSLFSGRNAVFGGARMLAIGAVAATATFFIGKFFNVAVG
ncbi:MAG: VIT1/CCC1 transporter family protein [Hyphomicrobium sp.]